MRYKNEYILPNSGYRFAREEKHDVYLLIGQSHAEGQAKREEIKQRGLVEYAQKSERFNSGGTANAGISPGDWGPIQVGVNTDGLPHTGTDFGVEVPILAYYYQLFGKGAFLVKSAFGGVGISEVLRGGGGSFHPDPAFSIFDNLTNPLIAGINRLNTQYGILPAACNFHLIWIHGEADSNFSPDDAQYGTHWARIHTDLIAALDAAFPGFAFQSETDVLVNTAFEGLPLAGVNLVNDAKIAWAALDPEKRRYLPTDLLMEIAANNHYGTQGTIHLGVELFKLIFFVSPAPSVPATPAGAPTSLTEDLAASQGSEVSWTAPSPGSAPIKYYKIYVDDVYVGRTTDTAFGLQDLAVSTTYDVKVSAVDTDDLEGAKSSGISITTLASLTTQTATTISTGGTYSNMKYTGQVTIDTPDTVIFKFCEFANESGLNDDQCVFVNTNDQDSHVEFYYCEWIEQPLPNGFYSGKAVHVYGYDNNNTFIVEHCRGTGYRGFWLQNMGDGTTTLPNIRVRFNQWENINQYQHDGAGGYLIQANVGPSENSQFIMINTATLGAGGSIDTSWNIIRNDDNESYVEDTINYGEVVGNASNRATISNNLVYGGYGYDAATYKGYSGGATQVEADSWYVDVNHNYILSYGNHGPAVSWGQYNRQYNNKVISSGLARGTNVLTCQSWRPLLNGNPFWQTANTINNEAYDNFTWFLENTSDAGCVSFGQVLQGVETSANNTSTNNTEGTGNPTQADEVTYEAEFLAIVAAAGHQIGYTL